MRLDRKEHIRILDDQNVGAKKLTQSQCERILMNHGASYEQAKNSAYVYLHHRTNLEASREGSKEEYHRLLDKFKTLKKQPKECIQYLEGHGFSYGQANSAVYKYRKERGLLHK